MKEKSISELKVVNQPVPKVDAEALVTGKAVYTDDIAPSGCLIIFDTFIFSFKMKEVVIVSSVSLFSQF